MGTVTISICDKCNTHLHQHKKGISIKTPIRSTSGEVLLQPGEYCVDCAASAIGHDCPRPSYDEPP